MATKDVKLTINNTNIENSINNINYYVERLQEIFASLDTELADLSEVYKSDASLLFIDKYDKFKLDFNKHTENFNSYVNDLKKLLLIVDSTDSLLSRKIEMEASDIK